jgi:hypothetical protein
MMRLFILLASLLQDGQTIEFPEPPQPAPVIQEERTEPQPNADTFSTDQLYLIQSDISLVILASPAGVLQVTPAKQGAVIFSRFAGGSGLEEKQITRANGYVVRGHGCGDGRTADSACRVCGRDGLEAAYPDGDSSTDDTARRTTTTASG